MMKILIVHTFYKLAGGEDTVVLNEVELLRNNGHEVQLLSFNNEGFSFVKLLLLPFNFFSYLLVRKRIKKFKPDVVHIHNLHFAASLSVIYAASSLKIPIVITLHNYRFLCPSGSLYFNGEIFLDSLKPGFPWKAIKNGVYRDSKSLTFWLATVNSLHRKLNTFKKVSAFIVLGEHSRQLFANSHFENYADNIVIKPNFSPDKEILQNDNQNYFLFVGRLTQEKGIETLIKAFSNTKINLKIVGSGPLKEMVLKAVEENENIEFLGQKKSGEIDQLFDNAEALIFPSEWFETFGMVLTEAFSKSIPVIASDLGNIKNIVEDHKNGLIFEAGNYLDLKEKVEYFKKLPIEIKQSYKESARKSYEEKYAPAANYTELIEIYRNVVNEHAFWELHFDYQ